MHISSPFSGHLSIFLTSHHFTFLWGPLPMLPSNWLSSSPYGTMYSLNVQCNAGIFYSLLGGLIILRNPKSNIYLREISKRRGKALSFTSNCLLVYINLFFRKVVPGNYHSRLKTNSQFVKIFKYTQMLTLQWSRLYLSKM